MGRTYDLSDVKETYFIEQPGEFTVKVISVTAGITQNNNPLEKVTFATKPIVIDEGVEAPLQISEEFIVTPKALWKLKIFVKALGLPDVSTTDDWIGRYVKITVGLETYTRNDNTKGTKPVIKKFEYSPLNEKAGETAAQLEPTQAFDAKEVLDQEAAAVFGGSNDTLPFDEDDIPL